MEGPIDDAENLNMTLLHLADMAPQVGIFYLSVLSIVHRGTTYHS